MPAFCRTGCIETRTLQKTPVPDSRDQKTADSDHFPPAFRAPVCVDLYSVRESKLGIYIGTVDILVSSVAFAIYLRNLLRQRYCKWCKNQ